MESTTNQRQAISLTVIDGPDSGMSRVFGAQARVAVGRGGANDFILTDGFVSNDHGELVLRDGQLSYRDLKSRHGSLVLVDDVSVELQDRDQVSRIEVTDGTDIQIGSTLIRVELRRRQQIEATTAPEIEAAPGPTEEIAVDSDARVNRGRETLFSTAMTGVDEIPGDLSSSDNRLGILFRLAGELNSQTQLDDILDLIVEAVFEAFPSANFLGITLADDPDQITSKAPFLTRVRGELPADDAPMLSTSILQQVVDTRESVLFVRDSLGDDISQSILDAQITACLCAPLIGQRSLLGVMQVDTRGRGSLFSKQDLNLFSVFASNVAFALERARLSDNIVEMFESFVAASVNAIEARDPTTAGHSERVADYTLALAETVNAVEAGRLSELHWERSALKELRYAALLHDFGKIAVRENILRKAKRLPARHLAVIEQRFETIKTLHYRRTIRDHFGNLDESLSPEKFRRLEEAHTKFSAEIDTTVDWLMDVAEAPFLQDNTIERVRRVGGRFFVDADGTRRRWLSEQEVDNLTIRKGTLNDAEWAQMKAHARQSEDYLKRIPWGDDLADVPCIAGAHHEKLDGSGYPLGLDAPEIVPRVRMLTIADIFDALTAADRPYRKASAPTRAVEILREEAGANKLDSDLVEIFASQVLPDIVGRIPNQ